MRSDTLLHDLIRQHAEAAPDSIAVQESGRLTTYRDLHLKVMKLASALRASGAAERDRIGLLLDNSLEAYWAIFGALASGGCYVPLNPTFPSARLQQIIQDAGIRAVVTVGAH